jgi:hypothetical protein
MIRLNRHVHHGVGEPRWKEYFQGSSQRSVKEHSLRYQVVAQMRIIQVWLFLTCILLIPLVNLITNQPSKTFLFPQKSSLNNVLARTSLDLGLKLLKIRPEQILRRAMTYQMREVFPILTSLSRLIITINHNPIKKIKPKT